ncbi:MAG: hypothetical protein ABI689_04040 [Thermoanaerobaculia bacterium]
MPWHKILTPKPLTALLAVLGGCAFLLFFRLAEMPVFGDETIYIQVGVRALHSGHWAPLLAGKSIFAWKPPLAVWGNAAGMALLGENELGARLVVGIVGLLLCALVAHFAWRNGNVWTMLLAPLALISAPPLLLEHGLRCAVPEAWLLLAVTGSFLWHLETAGRNPRVRLAGLTLLSMFSGWTKGIVGPLIVGGTLFLVELAAPAGDPPASADLPQRLRRAVSTAAAATFPGILFYLGWLLVSFGSVGDTLHFLQVDLGQRASSGLDPLHLQPPSVYLRAALANFGVGALLAPLALAAMLARDWRLPGEAADATRRVRLTILLWIVVVFVLFVLPSSRLSWYVYPAYPALALATAFALDELRRWLRQFRAGPAIFLLGILLLGAFRVQALVRAWPDREPHSLAALQHRLDADPAARAYTETALLRGPGAVDRLPGWHRFYLRRFVLLEQRALPADAPACSFVVTTEPGSWTTAVGGRLAGVTGVRGGLSGQLRLFVLDLCGGTFSGGAQEGPP